MPWPLVFAEVLSGLRFSTLPEKDGFDVSSVVLTTVDVGDCFLWGGSDTFSETDEGCVPSTLPEPVDGTSSIDTPSALPIATLEADSLTPVILWIASLDTVPVTLAITTWLGLGLGLGLGEITTEVLSARARNRSLGVSGAKESTITASLSESGNARSANATSAMATHSSTTKPTINGHVNGLGL